LTVAACAAVPAERPADEFNQARLCYAERELSGPRPACQGMRFLEAEGRVLESDFARRHLRLEHGPLPGYRPPGAYDYQVYPDYLLEAVAVGDTVRFVVESNSGDVVDVWPLLPGR
jgi:Cu/Ag efflux protein CusF